MKFFVFILFSFSLHAVNDNFQIIQPHEVASNYQVLKLTDEVFSRHQIVYWAWAGTLLGAVRHGGFIPWDFDTDVCILEKDIEVLLDCKEDFKKYNAYILPMDTDGQKTFYRIKRIKNGQEIYGHVDVFAMIEDDDRLIYNYQPYYSYYPEHFFLNHEVDQLIRIPFGPIYVNAPKDFMPYLKRAYGNDVMEIAEIMYTVDPKTGEKYPRFEIKEFVQALYEEIDPSIPLNNTRLFD